MKNPYYHVFFYRNKLWAVGGTGLLIIFQSGSGLASSWLLGAVLDAITAGNGQRMVQLVWFAIGLIAFMGIAGVVSWKLMAVYVRKGMRQYKNQIFQQLCKKRISAFSGESASKYISALTNDATQVEQNYLLNLSNLWNQIVVFFAALGMMAWYNPLAALAALGLSALPLLTAMLLGKGLASREKAVSDQNQRFTYSVNELLSGFSVLKSFRAEAQGQQLFSQANAQVEQVKSRRRVWAGLFKTLGMVTGGGMQMAMFFLYGFLAIRGKMSAGDVIVMVNLCNYLVEPMSSIPQMLAERKAAKTLIDKLARDTEENAGREGEPLPAGKEVDLELNHVTFGYTAGQNALKDVSLRFVPGKSYAVVGASGSGKSTLLNLLMGSYDSYSGAICCNGKELRKVNPDSLYAQMSLVGQQVFIFDDTIRRNVTMFRDFPEEQVQNAMEQAGLLPVVAAHGEAFCGENGNRLSGGERQRIAIARCLLQGAKVLLADEATAALDAETARRVAESLLALEGITRIVVTHRLEPGVMNQYDQIIVMKNGMVYEIGSFEQLMERKGQFYALYTMANG